MEIKAREGSYSHLDRAGFIEEGHFLSKAGGRAEVSGRCMVGETSGRGTGRGGRGAGRARAESWPRLPAASEECFDGSPWADRCSIMLML